MSTYDYLKHWAFRTPSARAAITPRRIFTYTQLLDWVDACVEILRSAGVSAGHRVAFSAGTAVFPRLVLFFALDKIGAASSVKGAELPWFDFIVANQETTDPRGIVINADSINHALRAPMLHRAEPPHPWRDAEVSRYYHSSGSASDEKVIQRSHGFHRRNLLNYVMAHPLGPGDVVLSTMGRATPGILLETAAWMQGAAVAFRPQQAPGLLEDIARLGVTVLAATPVSIRQALRDGVPKQAFDRLTLYFYGARADAGMLRRLLKDVTPNLVMNYGTSEAGLALMTAVGAQVPDDTFGLPMPSVSLDIVSNDGQSVQIDQQVGRIRHRCAFESTDGYVDAEGRCTPFPDQCFVSEDLGYRDANGLIHLLGRGDRVLNLGGHKLPFSRIDSFITESGLSIEHLCFRLEQDVSINNLVRIALQPTTPESAQTLLALLKSRWPTMDCRLTIFDHPLPRLDTEKIDLRAIQALAGGQTETMNRTSPSPSDPT